MLRIKRLIALNGPMILGRIGAVYLEFIEMCDGLGVPGLVVGFPRDGIRQMTQGWPKP